MLEASRGEETRPKEKCVQDLLTGPKCIKCLTLYSWHSFNSGQVELKNFW